MDGKAGSSLELAKRANRLLLSNNTDEAVESLHLAITKLCSESSQVRVSAKAEIDEALSIMSEKDRVRALELAITLVKANPLWLRSWRRWLLLTLPEELAYRLKVTRRKIDVLEKKVPLKPPSRTPIAVMTRAFNRLEYTMQCADGVAQQATDINYIHVVIDQNSDDGTEQWFNWLWRNPKPYWANLGYIRLKKNLGDWGGLVFGNATISRKYDRIMQLDNDSKLVNPHTLDNLSYVLDILGGRSIVMCRRLGAGDAQGRTGGDVPLLPLSRSYNVKLQFGFTKVYIVNHPVNCYMANRFLFNEAIRLGCTAACRFCSTLQGDCRVYKLHDVPAINIQGWDGKRFLQHEKYYKGSVATGMNYLKVSSEEILEDPEKFIDYTLPPASDKDWLKI
jgi:GT2 family glycosyltransferase